MSDYTTTVYSLMENGFDFGLNEYPIFDEEYRVILNDAILNHYKWREIGYQNPYQWRDRLRERISLIMRNKYNELYKKKQIEFNPLFNIDITETFEHKIVNTNNTNSEANTSGSNKNKIDDVTVSANLTEDEKKGNIKNSQFPNEAMLSNELDKPEYINAMNKSEEKQKTKHDTEDHRNSEETNEGSSFSNNKITDNGSSNENYTKKTEGSSAGLPFSKAMLQFKEYVEQFQLDIQVINELSDLFITVWEV